MRSRRLADPKISEMLILGETYSLDEVIDDDGETSYADLTKASERPLDDELAKTEWEAQAKKVVASLSERSAYIFHMRFWEEKTLQEIGDIVGLSRERVRQLIEEELQKLRDDPALEDFEDINFIE